MKKILLLFTVVLILGVMPAMAGTDTYPNQSLTVSGSGWNTDTGHFENVYDLTAGDITISFTYDGTGLVDDSGAHAFSELGVRSLGTDLDFNPYLREECDELTQTLIAGQHFEVGEVIVQKLDDYLLVKYIITESGWAIKQIHLAVSDSSEGLPQTNKGNPQPGQFPYSMDFDPPVTEYEFPPIDISGLDTPLYIAAHAIVGRPVDDCSEPPVWQIGDVETADCDGDLTNYANEFNWINTDSSQVGDCVTGPTLSQLASSFTDPFIVGTTPVNQFPYNSNYNRGYATEHEVDWTGGLPFGGVLTLSWSPGQSDYERKEVSGDGIASPVTFNANGTPSPGAGWFLDTYPLVQNSVELDPLGYGEHYLYFDHLEGDGTFWDWIKLEKPCEQWETAWADGTSFDGKSWGTYIVYNPACQEVDGSGVWLSTDYEWVANTFDPDPAGSPTQDLDDKLILQKVGGQDEGAYNLPSVPPDKWANHAVWFDRDGVDPYQALMWGAIDGVTYNTSGTYDVVITLHANDDTSGTTYMTINGEPQGFYVPHWHTGSADLMPAGMTFTGDLKHLQVFYGLGGYGATHSVNFTNITVTQP